MQNFKHLKSKTIPFLIAMVLIVGGGVALTQKTSAPTSSNPVQSTDITPSPMVQGEKIRVKGEKVCLPHKNTDGPQTLECAIGFKSIDGKYYALKDSDPEYKNITKIESNRRVVIDGYFTPQDGGKYQGVGILEITSVIQN